jgi:dTDP-4-amino-4,6-dideoxygalactose transaminase
MLSKSQNGSIMANAIPFALPDIGEEEIAAVVECLRSGWISAGPYVKRFEADMAAVLGGGVQTVAVNSGTSALLLALEAVGVGPGDEVITTTYTFSATAMAVVHLGAVPILVDIDPDTLNIDPRMVEAAVTPRTKAIVPVHIAGLACDMGAIRAIARRHGLKVVEDAAHAFPCLVDGKLVGAATADATIFSFYATKNITTGEGGMISTPHADVADRCRMMRLHGISRDVSDRYVSTRSSWRYEIVAPGYKCNMTDVAAAMGCEQLKKAKRFHARRQAIARTYREGLAGLPLVAPPDAIESDAHAWHLYVIQLLGEAPLGRDEFITAMSARGINCSVHFIPLHLHPFWRSRFQFTPESFPNATRCYASAVSLPLYTRMSDDDVQHVIETVRELLQ